MSNSNSIPMPTDPRFQNLTGKTFGRWTVLEYTRSATGRGMWVCQCSCGSRGIVEGSTLRRGLSKSCGCYREDTTKSRATTHGLSHSPEHDAWLGMRQRCKQKRNPGYAKYKHRSPDPVFDDFGVFLRDVGAKPSEEHSLDRIDNTLGYVPGNLRWATREEQANNTSANLPVRCASTGEVKNLKKACRDAGIPYNRVYQRLYRLGWDVPRATDGAYESI